ncbi:MAG: OmpA family protein [Bacteroidota bacterium]|uniref:OmpA family protein n=1 Tax=Parabacteroides sp. FAFU027 TaxID=2922715 RepID=UPI001FAEE47A|nr:OmpA family protein [Parabacteroides sp. FAFU027]MDP4272411.1 OmpA family protein [Bacteroidota bacterium]
MKKSNIFVAVLLSGSLLLSGCSSMSNAVKGGLIGGAGGGALGAGIGALAGKGKGAVIGAAIGTAVGGTAGVLIGKKMDKQKRELEAIQGAKTEEITDINGLKALKVTFQEGILFQTGKANLSASSKTALSQFATSVKGNPQTDIVVQGHTDITGGDKINVPLSEKRAASVQSFLQAQGLTNKITAMGLGSSQPVSDNTTAAGKAQNRRVEVYISANEEMIKAAESGTLK